MDLTECAFWFRQEYFPPFDKALGGVLRLAAEKGCTELEVNLRIPPHCVFVPWARRLKTAAKSLIHPFVREVPRFKLTKVDASGSSGLLSDPYGRATFVTIINSSTTLTFLSLDLFGERQPSLSSITAPSIQFFTLNNPHLGGKVFESFLSRHPNIKVLSVCGSEVNFPRTNKGLSVKLHSLEHLRCSTELLAYFLQNLDRCLPKITEVTVIRLVPSSPYSTLNRELEKIRSQLDGIPSLGLRTYPSRGIALRDFKDADLVRKYITRLEFEICPWTEPSRLGQWTMFPNVNCIKFYAMKNYMKPNPPRPLPLKELRSQIAQYPRPVRVVMEDGMESEAR
ncbi:hypothetical protein BDN72DRAFT_966306 [Pluteus cervinus]|uniref:Uncharacterized protein n=1 Tax=Pluteus cervinus TaxID=181527 RepID=A0ACD2ZYR0_9AGAR|nr:hypothetical protein BDN72DRAFT_966306 [Pluteus cervinus]